jgi:hypothetical protein
VIEVLGGGFARLDPRDDAGVSFQRIGRLLRIGYKRGVNERKDENHDRAEYPATDVVL